MSEIDCLNCAHCKRDFYGPRCLNERVLQLANSINERLSTRDARGQFCGEHAAYYEHQVKCTPIPTRNFWK